MFNFKRIKQKVAVALIVAMSVSATLPALAAGNAMETLGQGSYDKGITSVRVRFDPGPGGYWTKPMATKANSTVFGTTSDAEFEAPEIEYPEEGTPNDATRAPEGIISRRFTLRGWEDNSHAWEFVGDGDYAYITLGRGNLWFPGRDWENIANEDENMEFNGWYYKDQLVDDDTMIYSGSTEEERDKGIVLVAGWVNPDRVEVAENGYFTDHSVTNVEGLEEGQKLVVKPVEGEYADWEDNQEKMWTTLTDVLQRQTDLNLNANGQAGVDFIGIDIDVTNYVPDGNNHIMITLMAPEEFINDVNEQIYAVHFRSDGATDIIPVGLSKRESGRFDMSFTVMNGFSPFFFVKAQQQSEPEIPNEVKVTIKNVENGYVEAYTEPVTGGKKYLPIGEEVTIKAEDQPIYLSAYGYEFDDADWYGDCTSLEAVFSEEGKEPEKLLDHAPNFITEDCEIVATFAQEKIEPDDDDYWGRDFNLVLEPGFVSQEGKDYTGTIVRLRKYNMDTGRRETVPDNQWSVRPADADELIEKGFERNARLLDLFDFNAETKTLTSKQPLEIGYYLYPVVITYQGEEYKYYTQDGGEHPYAAMVQVGAQVEFYHSFVKLGDKYDSWTSDILGWKEVSYENTLTWGIAQPDEGTLLNGEPQMYNYEFAGWQDASGVDYTSDDQTVESLYEDEPYFEVYDLFVKTAEDGTVSKYAPEALGSGSGDTPAPDNNGSSGGGSRYGGGGSSSAARDYTMHGNWMATENGWRFLKDSGEYATNTWGYINGQWYYFDAQGNMVTGWYYVNGQWYYMNPAAGSVQGAMMTGWVLDPTYNAWFYLTGSGAMATGWQQINGLWYYLNPVSDGTKGVMAANTYVDGYFVNADGVWVQ